MKDKDSGFSIFSALLTIAAMLILFLFLPLPLPKSLENFKLQIEKYLPTNLTKINTYFNNGNQYQKTAEGVFGLRGMVIDFYNRTGRLPDNVEMMNLPLNNKSSTTMRAYLEEHHLRSFKLVPSRPSGQCQASIKINAFVDEHNINFVYQLFLINSNGAWKSVCTYAIDGANSTSISIKDCLNEDIPADQSEINKKFRVFRSLCY